LETAVTGQNVIQSEVKCGWNFLLLSAHNQCYRDLSKTRQLNYINLILFITFYDCDTGFLILI